MAKILAFRSMELKRDEGSGHPRQRLSGQVILFPGVRYERWTVQDRQRARDEATSPNNNTDCRRDVLELAE
jgi:hypothetical protein